MNRRSRSDGYRAATAVELLKVRRSRVPLMTFVAVSVVGCVPGLFMVILLDPERARRSGLLREKASVTGMSADWPGLLDFLGQLVAVGDLMLFAFVAAWVFGRESAEGTLRYLLALPVSRRSVALAKFTVFAGWAAAVDVWLAAIVLATGWVLGLPGCSASVLAAGFGRAGLAALLMLVVTTPVAFVACAGRGYLAPLAVAVALLLLGQIAAALGWGARWPWSVPAVAAGLVPGVTLDGLAVVLVVVTGLGGLLATLAWWRSGQAGR
jgi:ABC-2 type transport system permease protein